MRKAGILAPALVFVLMAGACAPVREPVRDVPPGNYVLIQPQSDVFNAVSIGERAHAVRVGDETFTGQHWLDADGRLHIMEDAGPCAGIESIWTYTYANDRVTMNLVEDTCGMRPEPFPEQMIYQRQP